MHTNQGTEAEFTREESRPSHVGRFFLSFLLVSKHARASLKTEFSCLSSFEGSTSLASFQLCFAVRRRLVTLDAGHIGCSQQASVHTTLSSSPYSLTSVLFRCCPKRRSAASPDLLSGLAGLARWLVLLLPLYCCCRDVCYSIENLRCPCPRCLP